MGGIVVRKRLDRRQGCILIPSLHPVLLHRPLSTIHLYRPPPLQSRSPLPTRLLPRIGPVPTNFNFQLHLPLHRLAQLHLRGEEEGVSRVDPAALGEDAGRKRWEWSGTVVEDTGGDKGCGS